MASDHALGGVNPPPRQMPFPNLVPRGTSTSRLLERERNRASFDSQEMSVYIFGQDWLDRMRKLLGIIEKEASFDKSHLPYLGRSEKFRLALRKEKRFVQLMREHKWTKEDMSMAEWLIDMPGPFGLHKSMFTETLRSQTTDEQKKAFLEPALAFKAIGAYAQTELGHGSNVQGLETTATYDPETKEFVINSPTLTSLKWWIGGLGRTATHCILMAQLIVKDQNCGIHPFFVPIRDPETRKPFPGIQIFDIGSKFGYQTTDNGAMCFSNIRVPHFNMLARFSSIDKETGEYSKPKSQSLAYGTMSFIRAGIVQQSRMVLARAVTVAIRYCAVRRQFTDRDAPSSEEQQPVETQVLNYSMVQYRLLPLMCSVFAFHYTGLEMFRVYEANQAAIAKGDLSLMAEMHAASSGLKSLVTIWTADAIEQCRRACGGHGFSSASGLDSQYQNFLPQVTWEGDSYMLPQQVARYLFKLFRQLWADPDADVGTPTTTSEYLRDYIKHRDAKAPLRYSGDLKDPAFFVKAFAHRAAYLIGITVGKRDLKRITWNHLLVDIHRLSKAHSEYLVIRNFAHALENDEQLRSKAALHNIVSMCFQLYACYMMDLSAAEFLDCGYLVPSQHEILRTALDELLLALRPQAVPIVDSFCVPDYLLQSALGKRDGGVYEGLVDFALREPLNGIDFNIDPDSTELAIGEPKLAKL